jgi:hypothetical protein
MRSNIIELEVIYQTETEGAVCFREHETGSDIWIPKSRCEVYSLNPVRGRPVSIATDEQMAIEKGLV